MELRRLEDENDNSKISSADEHVLGMIHLGDLQCMIFETRARGAEKNR